MSAVVDAGALAATPPPSAARPPLIDGARVALLGSGTVGRAVLERLASWSGTAPGGRLQLVHAANSRIALVSGGTPGPGPCAELATLLRHVSGDAVARLSTPRRATPWRARPSSLDAVGRSLGPHGRRIVIDATASELVARQHPRWLAQGIDVVTACKLGQGTTLAHWRAIRDAARCAGSHYGDSATVGAGLPLLRSLRELQAGGDRIHAVAGVLSGSLAWLFHGYDGMRPFSALVRRACAAGYTEPDPRDDLSGEDVRRKLVILARAAGFPVEPEEVDVASLVPAELARVEAAEVDGTLETLDAPLRQRFAAAYRNGEKLRFVARLQRTGPGAARMTVGLESLPADDPLASGTGTDNKVAIWSDRYRAQPLVIQGPGAGAEVTAAALLDDALRIARGAQECMSPDVDAAASPQQGRA